MNLMKLTGMNTVSSHANSMKLKMKWQEKQKKAEQPKTQSETMAAELKKLHEDNRKAQILTTIEGKMMAGKRLSKKELDYLKEHSPELYEKAVKIAAEREAYERAIKNAKSKEEVERIRQQVMQNFVAEAKAVMASNMPKAQKLEAMKFITMRMHAVLDQHHEFMETAEYHALPETDDDERVNTAMLEALLAQVDDPAIDEQDKDKPESPDIAVDETEKADGKQDGAKPPDARIDAEALEASVDATSPDEPGDAISNPVQYVSDLLSTLSDPLQEDTEKREIDLLA